MSYKQQLARAIEALPETLSIEEAVERLYRHFKLKQLSLGARGDEPAPILEDDMGEDERARLQAFLADSWASETEPAAFLDD